jgi:hypothetical protein
MQRRNIASGYCPLIGDACFDAIALHCHQLQYVDASGTIIGARTLEKSLSALPRLQEILLEQCINITDASLIKLIRNQHGNLKKISVIGSPGISKEAAMLIQYNNAGKMDLYYKKTNEK